MENKPNLITALNSSARELQQGIDIHCCLLTSVLTGRAEDLNIPQIPDVKPRQSRELMMKEAIREAIDELEETRKAFKSKKLEALRKKLTQVLLNVH
jgi:hypothetical protein